MTKRTVSTFSRRVFLGGVLAVLAAGVGAWFWLPRQRCILRGIAALVRGRLAMLRSTLQGLDDFAADQYALIESQLSTSDRALLLAAGICAPVVARFGSVVVPRGSLASSVDELTRRYLLASDFFLQDDAEPQMVTYLGPYHTRACANPFFARERSS